jgi:hypothetical protein
MHLCRPGVYSIQLAPTSCHGAALDEEPVSRAGQTQRLVCSGDELIELTRPRAEPTRDPGTKELLRFVVSHASKDRRSNFGGYRARTKFKAYPKHASRLAGRLQ